MNFLPNLFFFDGILHDHYILSTTQTYMGRVTRMTRLESGAGPVHIARLVG